MAPPYQTTETADLIRTFPEDFADALVLLEDRIREGEEQAREDVERDLYIAANFDECGNRFE